MQYTVASAMPIAKISASALGGAVSLLIVWALGQFAGIDVPEEAASAFTLVVMSLIGYLVPLRTGEVAPA